MGLCGKVATGESNGLRGAGLDELTPGLSKLSGVV
jgi:hypothetical protein